MNESLDKLLDKQIPLRKHGRYGTGHITIRTLGDWSLEEAEKFLDVYQGKFSIDRLIEIAKNCVRNGDQTCGYPPVNPVWASRFLDAVDYLGKMEVECRLTEAQK